MGFTEFIRVILSNFSFCLITYLTFVIGYLLMFRNRTWSFVDPFFLQVIYMGSAAYCVFILFVFKLVALKFIISFVLSEISFFLGFFLVKNTRRRSSGNIKTNYKLLFIFIGVSAFIYFIAQIYTFSKIGFILLEEGKNHVFAFEEFGVLRVFLDYSRMFLLIAIFYKQHLKGRFTLTDKIILMFVAFGTIMSGSKSALLTFFSIYIIVNHVFSVKTGKEGLRMKHSIIILLLISAILVIYIKGDNNIFNSLAGLFYRFIGSGDIFVQGYNDNVIRAIHEKSGLKYIFYPGFGTLLKWVLDIKPPSTIGVDITEYYTGLTGSGPNARHNFLGMYFWGYFGCIFSFVCGYVISFTRYRLIFFFKEATFETIILLCTIINIITSLITDANMFMNNLFWSFFMFLIIYITSSFIYLFIYYDFKAKG